MNAETIIVTPVYDDLDVTGGDTGPTVTATTETILVTVDGINVTASSESVEITVDAVVSSPVVSSVGLEIIEVGVQGPPGTDGTSAGSVFNTTNKQGSTIQAGQVVSGFPSGVGVALANSSDDTKPGIGLVTTTVVDQAACEVQTDGPFTLADWTAVTGAASLAARAVYYLETTDGKLTTTPPSLNPAVVHRIGRAVSPQILSIDIWGFVKL